MTQEQDFLHFSSGESCSWNIAGSIKTLTYPNNNNKIIKKNGVKIRSGWNKAQGRRETRTGPGWIEFRFVSERLSAQTTGFEKKKKNWLETTYCIGFGVKLKCESTRFFSHGSLLIVVTFGKWKGRKRKMCPRTISTNDWVIIMTFVSCFRIILFW